MSRNGAAGSSRPRGAIQDREEMPENTAAAPISARSTWASSSAISSWPDTLVHGDFHPGNLIGDGPDRQRVATEARRKEVYWARYDITDDEVVRSGEPM